jgi:hypothetical protein
LTHIAFIEVYFSETEEKAGVHGMDTGGKRVFVDIESALKGRLVPVSEKILMMFNLR